MYETFFEMKRTPFVKNVPPEMLYESRAMADAMGRLTYAADHQLFAIVTADAGCGKSTLIRRFVSSLPKDDYLCLYLSDSKLSPKWLYKGFLSQLGIEGSNYRGEAKRQLQKEMEVVRGVQGKKVICILDEAHLLDKECMEEFRFLLNIEFDSESPMTLVLVGQSEILQKLKMKNYDAIKQRIEINCVLPHLDRSETESYILSHLHYAGGKTEIFTEKALDEIYQISTGIERRINRICAKSLMYACQQNQHLIDEHLVQYVHEHETLEGEAS